MSRPALVVMSRWPGAGRCKSRLSSRIGPFRSAAIQRHLIEHTLAVVKPLELNCLIELHVAISGAAPSAAIRWAANREIINVSHQRNGSLGKRMRKEVINAQPKTSSISQKGRPTLLIGTDLPTLCQRDLIEALDALNSSDLVIGPSSDGGYWLIGLSEKLVSPVSTWPFSGIPWATDQVLTYTLQKASIAKVSTKLLNEQNDIDFLEDLSPWQA